MLKQIYAIILHKCKYFCIFVENNFYMEAKELFKSKMKARNVNMVWLSKQTGISNATLSRFFSGKTDLPLAKLVKICEELNIKIFPDESK